jgi:hypothetical protein
MRVEGGGIGDAIRKNDLGAMRSPTERGVTIKQRPCFVKISPQPIIFDQQARSYPIALINLPLQSLHFIGKTFHD